MGRPRKDGYQTLGVRLHESVIHNLKIEAVRRKQPVSELVLEACTAWWKKQGLEAKKGSLQ